jgi:hypothetical protein
MNMRKIVLLLLMCLTFSGYAQSKQVRVTTLKGTVYEGALLEFKSFEYLLLEVDGKKIKIDYKDMAYIDEIPRTNSANKPQPETTATQTVEVSQTEAATLTGYKGFLLESGNSVYIECISDPKNEAYNEAALDVLKRQLRRDGFWKIVDTAEESHFSIVCLANLQGKKKATIAISSLVTGNNEVLGELKGYEDVNEYRKTVWELYNKYILPMQKKIENNKTPKRTMADFTVK